MWGNKQSDEAKLKSGCLGQYLVYFLAVFLLIGCSARQISPYRHEAGLVIPVGPLNPEESAYVQMHIGASLKPKQARKFEEVLKTHPEDLESRVRLLGYYRSAMYEDGEANVARLRHLKWIVENAPGTQVFGSVSMQCDPHPYLDGKPCEELQRLWREKVEEYPESARVLGNAALYAEDVENQRTLYRRAKVLEPNNERWSYTLRDLDAYERRSRSWLWQCVSKFAAFETRGWRLKDGEIEAFERHLAENPNDEEARAIVISYYSGARFKSEKAKRRYHDHVLWMIRHMPDSALVANMHFWLHPSPKMNGTVYEEGKQIWLEHLAQRPKNIKIVANAANYFRIADKDQREVLLKQLKALEPKEPAWSYALGVHYESSHRIAELKEGKGRSDASQIALNREALAEYEQYIALQRDAGLPAHGTLTAARLALRLDDYAKARRYAEMTLDEASLDRLDFLCAERHHHAHIILGTVALKSGNVKKAKEHLIAAGTIPCISDIGELVFDYKLAVELLKRGERETVLKYLYRYMSYEPGDRRRARKWERKIKAGKIPTVDEKKGKVKWSDHSEIRAN